MLLMEINNTVNNFYVNRKPGIYLCSRLDRYPSFNIIYNDIEKKYKADLTCSCEDINLSDYSFIIATPPCNYYSKANYRRDTSIYSLATKHLLPYVLNKCCIEHYNKPFIIENICNDSLLPSEYDKYCYRFTYGGHTFWTNILIDISLLPIKSKQNKSHVCINKRDGNVNVHNVILLFLNTIYSRNFIKLTKCYIYEN